MRTDRSPGRRTCIAASALAAALGSFATARAARADDPPIARCQAAGAVQPFETPFVGAGATLAVATRNDIVGVVVQTTARDRRGATRVHAVSLSAAAPDRATARTVDTTSGHHSGAPAAVLLDDAPGGFVVVAAAGRGVHVIQVGTSSETDRVVALRSPIRSARLDPLIVARDGGVSILWREPGAIHVQDVALRRGALPARPIGSPASDVPPALASQLAPRLVLAPLRPLVAPLVVVPSDPRTIRLPHGAVPVSAARGPEGSAGVVLRTEGRHYVVAVIDAQRTVHYPRNAPAGCDRGRCQPVEILAAPGGFVAGWTEPPTRDGLRSPGARALDAAGHVRWSEPTFIPMARGVPIAGPDGQPMALQLGVPIVLRGGNRPVAIPAPPPGVPRAYPVVARAWVEPASPRASHRLGVAWLTAPGTGYIARLRCGGP